MNRFCLFHLLCFAFDLTMVLGNTITKNWVGVAGAGVACFLAGLCAIVFYKEPK